MFVSTKGRIGYISGNVSKYSSNVESMFGYNQPKRRIFTEKNGCWSWKETTIGGAVQVSAVDNAKLTTHFWMKKNTNKI